MSAIGSFTGSFAGALAEAEVEFGKDERKFQYHRGRLAGLFDAWLDLCESSGTIKERIFPDLIKQYGRRSVYEIETLLKKFKLQKYLEEE